MFRPFIILLLLFMTCPAYADRVYLEGAASRDSDDGGHYQLMSGYRYRIDKAYQWEFDVAAGTRSYTEEIQYDTSAPTPQASTEKERFKSARIALRGTTPKIWRYNLQLEQLMSDEWDLLVGSASLSARPNKTWYFEAFGERELVDTVSAIREKNHFLSYGFSVDYQVIQSLALVGAVLRQDFSDGNQRDGYIGRIIYYPKAFEWLNLQLKGRLLNADKDSDNYFSPERLQEYFLLFGIATPFADNDWVIRILAGPGTQIVEPFESEREEKDAYLAELRLRGWFSDNLTLESTAGCSSALTNTDTYSYCYGKLHLGYAW